MATNPDTKRAVFPGSFDPITRGHENILRRAAGLFDEVVVAIGVNQDKQSMFPLEQRIAWCEATFADLNNVRVDRFEGLTADYCRSIEAGWLIRGVRNGGDFEYERTIAQMTKYLDGGLDTLILFTDPEHAPISSSVVRDIITMAGRFPFLFPMQWTLDRVESAADFLFRDAVQRGGADWSDRADGAVFHDGGRAAHGLGSDEVIVEGLEGRPILIAERMPLTGALRPVKETFVGLDGHVAMAWPADGRLRFLRLDCAGSTWQLPVVIDLPEGTTLVPAPPGRAPFAERPGTVRLGAGPGDRTVERLARFLEALDEVESDAAVAWQKQWLRGDRPGAARPRCWVAGSEKKRRCLEKRFRRGHCPCWIL